MNEKTKDKLIFLLVGIIVGAFLAGLFGLAAYKIIKSGRAPKRYNPQKQESRPLFGGVFEKKNKLFLSFENNNGLSFFKTDKSTTAELSDKHATHGKRSMQVRITPGADYPGIFWEVYGHNTQNWRGAKDFHFDVYNNNEFQVTLRVKFKSGKDYPKPSYSYPVSLEPLKENHISIPITNIAQSCDITQMSYIKIFVPRPDRDIVLYFDNMGTRAPQAADAVASGAAEQAAAGTSLILSGPSQNKTTQIFTASSLDRIFRDGKTLAKPDFKPAANISLAQNEYESFQVVVAAGNEILRGVRLKLSALKEEKTGSLISTDNFTWRIVGYVPTKKPYYPVKYVGLWPDPLVARDTIDIGSNITQPFWVTVYAPEHTPAGLYKGTVEVLANDKTLKTIPVSVRVYPFEIPKESRLKTAFDFYGHITKDRYPRRKDETDNEYSARINELNDKYIIEMLKYRLNPILNVNPLSDAEMGKVDRYRWFGLNHFAIGKHGGTFNNNWPKSDAALDELMMTYRTYGEVLKLNHMLDMTYIYTWDEGKIGNPLVAKITGMIHKAYPGLKNMVCYHGFWDPALHPDWGKDIDIWCFQIDSFNALLMKKMQEKGIEMWMYVSGPGGSGSPNLAIDFDSIDYRIIPWLCYKYDIKGFLYWCVNWWPLADPFQSAANTKWDQNGNGLLFYPGANGPIASLRLEILRDGLEDYEYLITLGDLIKKFEASGLEASQPGIYKNAKEMLTIDSPIATSLRSFTKDGETLKKRRDAIADLIVQIKELLNASTDQEKT